MAAVTICSDFGPITSAGGWRFRKAPGWKGNIGVLWFLDICWLDLEKCCFVDYLVIFYEDRLSVAGKLDTHDEWAGRTNELFLLHSVKARCGAWSGTRLVTPAHVFWWLRRQAIHISKLLWLLKQPATMNLWRDHNRQHRNTEDHNYQQLYANKMHNVEEMDKFSE